MKTKKFFSIVTAAALAVACTGALTACGGNAPPAQTNKPGTLTEYKFEAEYVDLTGKQGTDISAEPQGKSLVAGFGEANCSNGYYIGATYRDGFSLEFEFKAEQDGSGSVTLSLASELGDIILTPDNFGVLLNDAEINYSQMTVQGSSRNAPVFRDLSVSSSVQIKKGTNVLKLVVHENNLRDGKTGGPMIDCVKIKTKAGLSWTPIEDNTDSDSGDITVT